MFVVNRIDDRPSPVSMLQTEYGKTGARQAFAGGGPGRISRVREFFSGIYFFIIILFSTSGKRACVFYKKTFLITREEKRSAYERRRKRTVVSRFCSEIARTRAVITFECFVVF